MLLNKEKESRVKFNPGLGANRPSNNWALVLYDFNSSFKINCFEKLYHDLDTMVSSNIATIVKSRNKY